MNSNIDGYCPTKYNDKFVTAAQQALSEFVDLIQPGTWIVDILPFRTFLHIIAWNVQNHETFQ